VVTTYTYDELNRLTQKSYSDGTPAAKYYYDSTDCLNLSVSCYNIGRRTGMSEGSGSTPTTKWAYDAMGNILRESRTINGVTKIIDYSYNLDGSIASIAYPGDRVVNYTYNVAQQATAASDTTNGISYASPSSLAEYAANGAPKNIVYGYVSGGGITETRTYNSRLQLTAIQAVANSSSTTVLDLAYSYPTGNNGNISTQTNNETSNRTQTYTYDSLNRLLTAQSNATSGGDCWGQSFGNDATPPTLATDALANLFYTSSTKCSSPAPQFTGDGSNHISTPGFSYDSAGNNTADAQWSYTYDAENRIVTASGMTGGPYCYTYDADGIRTMKSHGSSCATVDVLYWRNIAGNAIAETDSAGSTSNTSYREYIFFAGRRIAQADWGSSSFTVYYYFVDHLGSTRAMTTAAGSVCFKADYLPYGAENTPSGFASTWSTSYKFTGYERDAETGLDYAFARYYNSRLGRFMSGDPLGGDSGDPQSLNRYAYVRNNPINFTDPTGLFRRVRDGDINDLNLLDEIDPRDACFWYGVCNRSDFLPDEDDQGGGGGGGGAGAESERPVASENKPSQFQCAIDTAKASSPAAFLGIEDVPILGDVLGNSAADVAELGANIVDALSDFGDSRWNVPAYKEITWYFVEEKLTKAATNAFVVAAAFRNPKIARSLGKGFSPRTNLTKQFAKAAGRAKIIGDAVVFAAAYFYSCAPLGE
jgi:RHS repeat-associated protein